MSMIKIVVSALDQQTVRAETPQGVFLFRFSGGDAYLLGGTYSSLTEFYNEAELNGLVKRSKKLLSPVRG